MHVSCLSLSTLDFPSILPSPKKSIVTLLKKVSFLALKILFFPVIAINLSLEWSLRKLACFSFFSSFSLDESTLAERRRELFQKGAQPLSDGIIWSRKTNRPVDALLIKSKSDQPTGNVVIYVLAKLYQRLNPKDFEPVLEGGADVILFNPSQNNMVCFKDDLETIIKTWRSSHPDSKIALQGYSVGAHVAASVVSESQDPLLTAILDRGYANSLELAKSVTILTCLPYARQLCEKVYGVTISPNKTAAPTLFIRSQDGDDKLLHRGIKNLSQKLFEEWAGTDKKIHLLAKGLGHWSKWDGGTKKRVQEFLIEQGIIHNSL